MLKPKDVSNCNILVTFGHVLIQAKKNHPEAMRDFAGIIKNLFPSNFCIVVTVDAYSSPRRVERFCDACTELRDALEKVSVYAEASKVQYYKDRSVMYAPLDYRG